MKKLIIATLIFAGASTVSFAQTSKTSTSVSTNIGAESKAKAETDKLAKSLDLNAEQKVKLHQVNVHYATQMGHIADAGPAASPERSKYILKYKEDQYKAILNADQYAKYQQLAGTQNAAPVSAPKSSN